jgi:hypothetical protein
MEITAICLYCDHKRLFHSEITNYIKCEVCGDANIKYKKIEDSKVDYYVGCPPFPPKKESLPKEKDSKEDLPDEDLDSKRISDYIDYLTYHESYD